MNSPLRFRMLLMPGLLAIIGPSSNCLSQDDTKVDQPLTRRQQAGEKADRRATMFKWRGSDIALFDPPSGVTGNCIGCHQSSNYWLQSFSTRAPVTRYVASQVAGDAWHHQVREKRVATQDRVGAEFTSVDEISRNLLKLPKGAGVVVASVCPDDEANAGLQVHDVVLKIDQEEVKSADQLNKSIDDTEEEFELTVLRNGDRKELSVKAPPKTKSGRRYMLGIVLNELEPVVKSQLKLDDEVNIVIGDVREGSAAEKAGLQELDIIVKINAKAISDVKSVTNAVAKSEGAKLKIVVLRDGTKKTIEVTPETIESDASAKARARRMATTANPYAYLWSFQQPGYADAIDNYSKALTHARSRSDSDRRLDRIEETLNELKKLIGDLKSNK